MALLVSAKGSDVLAWRAAGDFAVTYRQVILDRMEFCRSDEAAAMLSGAFTPLKIWLRPMTRSAPAATA